MFSLHLREREGMRVLASGCGRVLAIPSARLDGRNGPQHSWDVLY